MGQKSADTPESQDRPDEELAEDGAPESAGASAASGASAEAESERAKLTEEKDRLYDQMLRLRAEFENYRKRVDREKPELVRHGREDLLQRLIPLYDTLLSAHDQIERHDETAPTAELKRGLELIFKEFTRLFEAERVSRIDAVGQQYDFHKHDALGQVETEDVPEGTVVDEIQRGYTIDGRVLRPAKVRIARKPGQSKA